MLRFDRLMIFAGTVGLLIAVVPGTAFADYGNVTCDETDPYCEIAAGDDGGNDSSQPPSNGGGGEESPREGEDGGHDCTEIPPEDWPEECLPDPQAVPIADLAAEARGRLVLPDPEMAASPATRQLVHLPVWLAVAESSWDTVSASVTAGGVTVTATAAPSRVEWTLGDGTEVICEGPGTVWRPGMDPEAESPDCGHTYTRSTLEAAVTATVFWTVTWTSTTGSGGSFTDLATTAQEIWEVAEARSVIVR